MKASPERLEEHVRMLSETFVPRDYSHVENLGRVADYLQEQLSSTCETVHSQPFEAGGRTYRNVCALLGPLDAPRIVVGAHYDAAGPYPGADDNASGVAGLLELARTLEPPSEVAVELVGYCLEEPPFFFTKQMGSYVHAASLREEGVDLRVMIALEMIGYFSDEPRSQRFPLPLFRLMYPERGTFIAVVGKLFQRRLVKKIRDGMRSGSDLPVHSLNAPRIVPGVALSDHLSYWRNGFPAVMLTDTAMYRNPNYHRASDTPGTLDYERMAMVVDGVRNAVHALGSR